MYSQQHPENKVYYEVARWLQVRIHEMQKYLFPFQVGKPDN